MSRLGALAANLLLLLARVPLLYRPRHARATVLHAVVREHLADFPRAAAAVLDRVKAITRETLAGGRVRAYLLGSWTSGAPRRTSDIDVAIDPVAPPPGPRPPGRGPRLDLP